MNTTNTEKKHYAKRDPESQGIHYENHVSAMTTEGLHAKSAIAAELAHRDIEIERLRAALATPAQVAALVSPSDDGFMSAVNEMDGLYAAPLAITSAPKRIWLNLGFNPCEDDVHFSRLHDLTWSQNNATGDGIEYVRADLAAGGAAQAAPVDAERLDYLQECGVTVEVLPGRPGWTFRIGGLHGTVHRSVRTAIDAARAAQKGTND